MKPSLTQEQAKELFEYKDGILYWKTRHKNSRKAKDDLEAGTVSTYGYKRVTHKQVKYYVHQLVFLLHHGFIPKMIDHIDGDCNNNKIENLRESNKSKNACNSKIRKDNTSGCRGVTWQKKSNKWLVQVIDNKKTKYLGLYKDFELACLVSNEARSFYHKEHAKL